MGSNNIVQFANTAVSVDDLDSHLARAIQSRPQANRGGRTYLRLSADGEGWLYGADNIPVEDDSLWAVNPYSLRTGWVNWANASMNNNKRERLGEVMSPAGEDLSKPTTEFSDRGGSWQEQVGFDLICVLGEDEGVELAYDTSSGGGGKFFDALTRALVERPDRAYPFPIIELKFDSYKNQTYNRLVFVPELKIRDWANQEQQFQSQTEVTMVASNENEAPEAEGVTTETAPEAEVKRPRKRRVSAA